MKRFLIFTNVSLDLSTLIPLIFINLIIANKVLYDNNNQIEDFVNFYPFFTIEQVTWMEKKYLEFIDYKLFISEKDYKIRVKKSTRRRILTFQMKIILSRNIKVHVL
jgi:hypothetical protein